MQVKKVTLIPFVAGTLVLLHTILLNAVTPPADLANGVRYSFYWVLVVVLFHCRRPVECNLG